jgi:nickel-dependent lactate racemase
MSTIDLAYGGTSLPLSYDETRFQVLAKEESDEHPLSDVEIGNALDSPISSPSLDEILSSRESVLIVVSDATRATASAQITNLLVRRLIQNGISPSDIAIIFATGIHRRVRDQEKTELLTPFIVQILRTVDHEPHNPEELISYGRGSRGTEIQLNKALREFDHIIVTGGIAFHYFAGFTGGRKSICPGLAGAQTVRDTHVLALDFENGGRRKGVATGVLDGNVVHLACEEIAEKVNPSFSINSVVDHRGRAVRVHAGHWRKAHRIACDEYLVEHSLPITAKRDVVITSCGGSPYDVNLIQAHKALEMASYACNEGGTIVWLAQCNEGLGRPDFLKWFSANNSSELEMRLRDQYEVNGQTAWALLTKAERFRILLVSQLPNEEVERMKMIPAGTLDEALSEIDIKSDGYILPYGAKFLPTEKR